MAGAVPAESLGRGVAFRGTVWMGGDSTPIEAVALVAADGTLVDVFPSGRPVPEGVRELGGPDCWVGPGVVDAHVHLAFGGPELAVVGGVVGVRDLGAARTDALTWRTGTRPPPGGPVVAVAGPLLTAPGGYPSRSWGAGYAEFVASEQQAHRVVADLASDGVDVLKLALEPGPGWPVPDPRTARAVVDAGHAAGRPVVAHALTVAMVERALDAGVDELAHTPTEVLPERLVDRIADAGVSVVSTLQTLHTGGHGTAAAANAAALHRAGVVLRYGTDLGNDGTRPGVDPRELRLLRDTGMRPVDVLRAATDVSAAAPGMRATGTDGRLHWGKPAALVLLDGNPAREPEVWSRPLAVVCSGRIHFPRTGEPADVSSD